MVKIYCDDCKAPLDDLPRIMIPQMIIVNALSQGQAQGLHFCGRKCLNSFLVKHENAPPGAQFAPNQKNIIAGPNG